MLTGILILVLLLPFALLILVLENLYSPDEMAAMGIHLENARV